MRQGVEEITRNKMEARGLQPDAIEDFLDMVRRGRDQAAYVPLDQVSAPDAALILERPGSEKDLKELAAKGVELLKQAVVIKLNGGRSTTMGARVPKAMIEAKDGRSYLDITLGQIDAVRNKWRVPVPLILMNSFFTHDPTTEILNRSDVPAMTFIQGQVPRLAEETWLPVDTGTDEDWVPPGHGDVYRSLHRTGLLEKLRSEGSRWAFISNLDNLAACLDPWILGLIEQERIEFLLEVTNRTQMDRKGGTLVVREGKLDLLEIAQVAPDDRPQFMDIDRFRVFNTNNVWVDIEALSLSLANRTLNLPIIQNRKKILGMEVIQLETAMGAAVGAFPRARGLRVGRDRFFPTKMVADLFVLQSDASVLDAMNCVKRNPLRPDSLPWMPTVFFGPEFLDSPLRMKERFEDPGSVSLVNAISLAVSGPVFFERDVKIDGNVEINASSGTVYRIPRGTVLKEGKYP
jgi:UTP--glucose-1-phosphate uridylyltransferase